MIDLKSILQDKQKRNMYLGWLAKRLVMLAYDIFVVNISYYLALVIRFWVNNNFRPIANNVYIPAYENFTPYYTILAIIVFILFQLYSSKWKFAGMNDLNRILSANIVTAIIHVLGTVLFVQRMPITYYCIGAFIQFALIAASRFAYTIYNAEKKRIVKKNVKSINVMLVGSGKTARIVRHQIENDPENAANLVCIFEAKDEKAGLLDGIPYVGGMKYLEDYIERYKVAHVYLADTLLSKPIVDEIKAVCEKKNIEFSDFSSYFNNDLGNLTLGKALEYIHGPVILITDEGEKEYIHEELALQDTHKKYYVKSIFIRDNKFCISLSDQTIQPNDTNQEWVKQTEQMTGESISFF